MYDWRKQDTWKKYHAVRSFSTSYCGIYLGLYNTYATTPELAEQCTKCIAAIEATKK